MSFSRSTFNLILLEILFPPWIYEFYDSFGTWDDSDKRDSRSLAMFILWFPALLLLAVIYSLIFKLSGLIVIKLFKTKALEPSTPAASPLLLTDVTCSYSFFIGAETWLPILEKPCGDFSLWTLCMESDSPDVHSWLSTLLILIILRDLWLFIKVVLRLWRKFGLFKCCFSANSFWTFGDSIFLELSRYSSTLIWLTPKPSRKELIFSSRLPAVSGTNIVL